MTLVSVLYGIGISFFILLALIYALKALVRASDRDFATTERDAHLQGLLDERDRLLLNMKDLGFDHAVRKVSAKDKDEMEKEIRVSLAKVLVHIEEAGIEPDAPNVSGYES
jgi:hypothetical protein